MIWSMPRLARAPDAGSDPRRRAGRRGCFARPSDRLKAHLTAVQTMTAYFTQTDAKGPHRQRHAPAQVPGPGPVRIWRRRPAARRRRQDADLRRL